MSLLTIEEAVACLHRGEIIAYPTEAVFGLGCCPQNEIALSRLVALKERSPNKGMILIASDVSQILSYLDLSQIPAQKWLQIQTTWPGPYTWVIPASAAVQPLVRGSFNSIAVRITNHPVASALCRAFNGPLISTSANKAACEPYKKGDEVLSYFGSKVAGVVEGEVGDAKAPTTIQDALTDEIYRR